MGEILLMKSMLKASSVAVLSLAALSAAPMAFAQGGPFADVPTDHWAYGSVDKLQKDGIVIGYPDGTYGGKRSMTRYEFAVAIARLLDKVQAPAAAQGGLTRADLDAYALKSDLAAKANQADLDALRSLVNEFQQELTTLGVDLEAVKKRLDALEGRVRAIENELKRVQIGGAVNLMARGNNRGGSSSVVDNDGYEVTGGRGSRGGILADARVLHDVDVNIKARLSNTATAETVLNFGNYLPFLNSITSYSGARSNRAGFSGTLAGTPVFFAGQQVNQDQQQTVYKAMLTAPISIPRLGGIDLSIGRVPIQFTPYTLKLIDTDAYFFNTKTDLGDIPVDGIKGSGKLGPVSVTGFAAKTDPIKYQSNLASPITGTLGNYGLYAGAGHGSYLHLNSTGTAATGGFQGGASPRTDLNGAPTLTGNRPVKSGVNPGFYGGNGAMAVEQAAGVRATFGTSKFGTIGGTYIAFAGTDAQTFLGTPGNIPTIADRQNFDRVFLYSGDINVNIAGIAVIGSYTQTNTAGTRFNSNGTVDTKTRTKTDDENYAWDIGGTFTRGAFGLNGGYKEVRAFFGAPGYWDKLGSYTNPTDIRGPYVKGSYAFSPTFALEVGGKFYKGTGKRVGEGGLNSDDKITNFKAGLKYGLTGASNIDAGIEQTEYDVQKTGTNNGRGKPKELFYNIGYGYSFNPATSFKVLYQIINYRDNNTGFDTVNGRGGVGAAQFSVKF